MADEWMTWVPVLKVTDAQASADFYCEVLGFTKDWEHRFADDFPLYVSVSRDQLCLHLSEHEGGGTRIGDLFIAVRNVDETYSQLVARGLQPDGPPEDRPYGVRDFGFSDADGHHFVLGADLETFEEAEGRSYPEDS